jgi:uncharacterized protein YfdQ (DUF2303 family)
MMDDAKSILTVRDLARESMGPQTSEKVHYALVPEGSKLVSLRDQQYPHGLPPERIVAGLSMLEASSFCSYVNSFKDHRTRIFADTRISTLGFLAVLDYHPAGSSEDNAPQFLSHRAAFVLRHSEEWLLWHGKHDKLIPQSDFAEFLEDNRADIVKPDSATMLEVAKDLQAHSEVNFASKINSQSGAATLTFDEQIKATVATGQITVPEIFTVRIPVFFGEPAIDIHARLRFRISGGKLSFQFKLYRPAEVISKAFYAVRSVIAEATTLEVLLGTI